MRETRGSISQAPNWIQKLVGHAEDAAVKSPLLRGISSPSNFVKRVHVDADFNWFGGEGDPKELFELQEKLGEGAFGSVYKALLKESGFVLAVKQIQTAKPGQRDDIQKEIDLLKQCSHRNCLQYYGCVPVGEAMWILTDYCAAGSVSDCMELTERTMTERQLGIILASALEGLEFLHGRGVVHRDLKCANILLTDNGEVKIADFGVSERLTVAIGARKTVVGTPYWMSPEVIIGDGYGCEADIWSIGITAIEMADGVPPLHTLHPMRAMFKIPYLPPPSVQDPTRFSAEFIDFLSKCLTKDPKSRLTATQLLAHPFVAPYAGKSAADNKIVRIPLIMKVREAMDAKRGIKPPELASSPGVVGTPGAATTAAALQNGGTKKGKKGKKNKKKKGPGAGADESEEQSTSTVITKTSNFDEGSEGTFIKRDDDASEANDEPVSGTMVFTGGDTKGSTESVVETNEEDFGTTVFKGSMDSNNKPLGTNFKTFRMMLSGQFSEDVQSHLPAHDLPTPSGGDVVHHVAVGATAPGYILPAIRSASEEETSHQQGLNSSSLTAAFAAAPDNAPLLWYARTSFDYFTSSIRPAARAVAVMYHDVRYGISTASKEATEKSSEPWNRALFFAVFLVRLALWRTWKLAKLWGRWAGRELRREPAVHSVYIGVILYLWSKQVGSRSPSIKT
ncbi:kinase-like domain-containing protein [Fimicolochytrium jonesii]|uniref:kinase-like domain-containing protein n=1 Tax=Fimicolochytrium jonesii TaxID=1396493 RepID=UPI0022FDBD8F|nr:kinase-like domain-containing protein [Fimicolochytrium jonesii]KAI8826612.1 kinase-like domain-containing protein [Fimicolochytrium jonesii]